MTRTRVSATGKFTLALLVLVLGGTSAFVLLQSGVGVVPDPERCVAEVGGRSVVLDHEQAGNAALIAGVAVRRGLPARAVTIALAAAYQESQLRNLRYGDRDSLGLFQQRPSQGWGTKRQVLDPRYAAGRFYDALAEVEGYRNLRVTAAAQRVQRSGFGDAYAGHETDARVVASALTGYSRSAFACVVRHGDAPAQPEGPSGLTPRARSVLDDLRQTFGELQVGGFRPGGVSSGHMEGSAHYDARAVDVFFRPVTAENRRRGWAVAHYLVARAARLGVQTVIFDDRIWQSDGRSDTGWRDYRAPSRSGDPAVLEHRDHVHVDVVGARG
ncbi:MAG: hypothetical protein M3P83_11885 [Actinomycetota bacterium]|nr:hypothetical protein [Actinomycetota bacterium]